jgi:mRNA interferase YafQ
VSYQIVPSKRFLKALKKCQKGGRRHVLASAEEAIHLLCVRDRESLAALVARWRDHPLTGDKQGIRELHLGHDDLLLYAVDDELELLKLLDIVNHEELRKQ